MATLRGGPKYTVAPLRTTPSSADPRRAARLRDHLLTTTPPAAALEALQLGDGDADLFVESFRRDPIGVLRVTRSPEALLSRQQQAEVVRHLSRVAPPERPEGLRLIRTWLAADSGAQPSAIGALQGPLVDWARPLLAQAPQGEDQGLSITVLDALIAPPPALRPEDLAHLDAQATHGGRSMTPHVLRRLMRHPAHPRALPPGAA